MSNDEELPKKRRITESINDKDNNKAACEKNTSLSNFQVTKILNNNTLKKVLFIQGTFKDTPEDPAIVILEKTNFPEENIIQNSLFTDKIETEKEEHNDIYKQCESFFPKEFNAVKTVVIHPATEKHIAKFTVKPSYLVEETYNLYKNVTLPYLESEQFSLQWVDNILNHKAEYDKIIYEDPDDESGFIILPDLKWDGNIETLNMLVLSRKKIKSIRELNAKHLPLLNKIKQKGSEVLKNKFNLSRSQLRMYCHYQPSYYHFHVHITTLSQEINTGFTVEKAHILSTIISNIELMSDYYQKVTLPFLVYKDEPLYKIYKKQGIIEEVDKKEETIN